MNTLKTRNLAYSKRGNVEEIRIIENGSKINRKELGKFAPLLDCRAEQPSYERLKKMTHELASMRDRRIKTTLVFRAKTVDGECVEKEVSLYDPKEKLVAFSCWYPEYGVQFTRVD